MKTEEKNEKLQEKLLFEFFQLIRFYFYAALLLITQIFQLKTLLAGAVLLFPSSMSCVQFLCFYAVDLYDFRRKAIQSFPHKQFQDIFSLVLSYSKFPTSYMIYNNAWRWMQLWLHLSFTAKK